METKINIAEILESKSQGTKLYDLLYNIDVELDTISTTDTETVVWCTNETDNNTTCHRGYSEFGTVRGCSDGLQILLPSKEMRDWGKFAWKKGDVLVCTDGKAEVIFERFDDDNYTSFVGKHYLESYGKDGDLLDYEQEHLCDTANYTKESDETVQCYINTIEKRLGGKLNRETLEVEKAQPEFKDGDIVFMKGIKDGYFANCIFILRSEYKDGDEGAYYYAFYNADDKFTIAEYGYTRVHYSLRLATDSEKQQLFDALAKKGKRWDIEKKQIVDLKLKWTPKPFDKVVVRCGKADKWSIDFFSYKVSNGYICTGDAWFGYCLPYNEETAHLLGTTDDWEGGEQ